jgi:hypothetical protein
VTKWLQVATGRVMVSRNRLLQLRQHGSTLFVTIDTN